MSWPDDLAERLQPLQPPGERVGHVLGGRPVGRRRLRQQQPRFQIGEPRRHHQIVGGKLEPQLARLLDEDEILLGQRQDRDLGEIDLLLAGERQQQVERALEALDVDQQRRLVGAALGAVRFRMLRLRSSGAPGRHHGGKLAARRGKIESRDGDFAHSQSGRRRAAPPRRQAPGASATARISSSLPLQCSTTSQPAASAARVRSAIDARQARPSRCRRSSTARRIR